MMLELSKHGIMYWCDHKVSGTDSIAENIEPLHEIAHVNKCKNLNFYELIHQI